MPNDEAFIQEILVPLIFFFWSHYDLMMHAPMRRSHLLMCGSMDVVRSTSPVLPQQWTELFAFIYLVAAGKARLAVRRGCVSAWHVVWLPWQLGRNEDPQICSDCTPITTFCTASYKSNLH